MPRYLLTSVAAIACVTCAGFAFLEIRPILRPPDASFDGPGTFSFTAPVAGEYTLWNDLHATSGLGYSIQETKLPEGAVIKIAHLGKAIQPTTYDGVAISSSRGKRKSVLLFVAPEPGAYLIETSGFPPTRSFEITHGAIVKPVLLGLAWAAGAALAGLLAIIFLIIALVRRPHSRQNLEIAKG